MGQLHLLFICLQALPLTIAKNDRFQRWFPNYREDFEDIVSNNCSDAYQAYLAGTGRYNKFCSFAVDCILGATLESQKANMASAAVILGLTPTILTMLGCRTTEIALLSTRRPFLSLLLALGSPSAVPVRTYEYDDVFEILKTNENPRQDTKSFLRKVLEVVAGYLLAIGAILNVAVVSYELGQKALFNFACNQATLASVWAFLAVLVQIFGCVAFQLRFQRNDYSRNGGQHNSSRFAQRLRNEFSPCSTHAPGYIGQKSTTFLFLFLFHALSWFTAAGAVAHILFGTLVFSSLTFISVNDALPVATRYVVSAIVCRAILMFELAGMRQTTDVRAQEDSMALQSMDKRPLIREAEYPHIPIPNQI